MNIISEIDKWMSLRNSLKGQVGFVPTMGALHSGHAELIKRSLQENDFCVVSIFVNPTQFNDSADFKNYPESHSNDIELCEELGVHVVLLPSYDLLYVDSYRYRINEYDFSKELCGSHREDHFTGVLTVVMKLLNLVRPHRAYFGEKDYQQLLIIGSLVKNLLLPIEVVSTPTIREDSGLAMSSRNTYLSKSEFRQAPKLYKCIKETIKMIRNGDKDYEQLEKEANIFLEQAGFKVEYYSICDSKTLAPAGDDDAIVLVAAWLGKTRLIDNARVHTYD